MKKNGTMTAMLIGALIAASAGCAVVYREPPYAPPHGHVVHYEANVDLVFDSGLGLYVVTGYPAYYYYRGYYYHVYADGRCERSKRFAGPWKSARMSDVPPGLAKKEKHHEKHYD